VRLLALIALLVAPAAPAQTCPGDCNGDGAVRIEELVLGVRIALGDADLATCPAFDTTPDGTVRIDELIRAAGTALSGCPATPAPTATAVPTDTPAPTETVPPADTPTPTETETETPTVTETATPTIPVVAGHWLEAALTIDDTTCPDVLTDSLAQQFASRGSCEQTVSSTGESSVHVTDCSDQSTDGTLERDGTIRLDFPATSDTVEGCTVMLSTSSAVNAASSPTVARYTFGLAFSGACEGLPNCLVRASGSWTRIEP